MERGTRFVPTDQQRQTVRDLVAFGHSYREVADYLDMSTHTLENHFQDELKKGKIDLGYKCGAFLLECVKNPDASTKDRISAATFILSRLFKQWREKEDKEKADESTKAIRDDVESLRNEAQIVLKSVDKDVDANDGSASV